MTQSGNNQQKIETNNCEPLGLFVFLFIIPISVVGLLQLCYSVCSEHQHILTSATALIACGNVATKSLNVLKIDKVVNA